MDFRKRINYNEYELERQIAAECGVDYSAVISELDNLKEEIDSIIMKDYTDSYSQAKRAYSEKNLIRCGCGNSDQTQFVSRDHEGEIVCKECGAVVSSNALYEGDASRSFEGEDDNSQYGAPFNKLMSSSFNLSTRLVSSNGKSTKLQRQQNRIDMNLSKTNKDNKETRIEYKDKRMNKARITMDGITRNLDLGDAVLDLAHRYFCYYRKRDKVSDENRRIAEFMILALREKRSEEKSIRRVVVPQKSFICPKCGLSFGTKLDLRVHECEKKEIEPKKKKMPPLSSLLRPKLKDDVERLEEIIQSQKK